MNKVITKKCSCGNVITVTLAKTSPNSYDQRTTGAINMDWTNRALCSCNKIHYFTRSINAWWNTHKG